MRRLTSSSWSLMSLAAVASLLQSGCQTAPQGAAYRPYPQAGYDYGEVSPAAGPMPASTNPYAAPMQAAYPVMPQQAPQQQVVDNSAELKDRLERLEKALLRLDRRMQLVERKELQRMSGGDAPAQVSQAELPSLGAAEERAAMQDLQIGPAAGGGYAAVPSSSPRGYQDGFRPVSDDGTIRSALQAAPRNQIASAQMPSLADTSAAAGRSSQAATDVAVWTIRYDGEDKVWPDRAQLPLSRDVVDALRNSPNATLFARGPNPNGKQFRERVKAISRYLAKVTSLDTVPIAALPSPQLGPDTIEILATH